MDDRRVILIEFNELSAALLDRFIGEGVLPHFAAFRAASDVFTTEAGESEATLVPWIQWPSIHTGQPYTDHGIFHLGDAARCAAPTIASVLSDAGIPVGVFGGMNMPARPVRGFRLPDPWENGARAEPASLQPYYDVTAEQVKESSHHGRLTARDAATLGTFYARHGFRPSTAFAIARQLIAERLDRGVKWRRAALFDRIQYDVFRAYARAHAVRFASFFSNSTAHYQHLYWRNMEPQRFPDPPSASDHPTLRDAIREGYRSMDRLIGKFVSDFPGATLIFATGLSQEPYTGPVIRNYRPIAFDALLAFAGIENARIAPVMSQEFHVLCADETAAADAERALLALEVDGVRVFAARRDGAGVFAGCVYLDPSVMERAVVDTRSGARRAFADLFYLVDGFRSGHHHPDGVLWIRTGRGRVHADPVSILDIAPTVLAMFGIAPAASMRGTVLPVDGVPAARALAQAV
ncbi:MAG: hypothetical protein QOD51_3006 [Candidatus Eremiobacteraeota bacterium]|jgi:hypothetical protein|nr:hypothetical protein [Candidatus Eremiobacteraeota bacterium]